MGSVVAEEKNKGGRPPHKPTAKDRATVELMAGHGITQDEIANSLGITRQTLAQHYRKELDAGVTKANEAVAKSLYDKATGEGSSAVTAAIFWLKCRAGWKEPKQVELTGKDGAPIDMQVTTTLNVDQMSARAIDALEEALEIMIAGEGDDDEDEGPAN